MKIYILASTLKAGGAERVISILSNEFVSMGHNVEIDVSRFRHTFYEFDKRINIKYLQDTEDGNINILKKVCNIRKNIKNFNPDIVLAFAPHTCFMVRIALIGLNIPFIISERNDPNVFPKNKILRFLYFNSLNKSSGIIFQTKEAMDFYKNYRKKTIIIKNPIIVNEYKKTQFAKVILNVGRITEQKNQKLLIDAFDIFYEKFDDYKLLIYGEGELILKLSSYVNSKKSHKNIYFMGLSKTWLSDNRDASMFILSSNYEGIPNTLIEAMSAGIPCISTDCPVGGPREFIKDGVNGFLVPLNNKYELSKKMILLAEDLQLKNKFSTEGKKINMEINANKIANDWIEFIKDILFSYEHN